MTYRHLRSFCCAIACCFLTAVSSAQSLTTEGTEFWLSYLDNWLQDPNNPIILELYISADDTTSGTFSIPLIGSLPATEFTVIPGATTVLSIPPAFAMAVGSGNVQNIGVHVVTDKDVSVYAMNKRQFSADMAMVLPITALGSDYYVMAHWEDGNRDGNLHSDSEFLIVSVNDGTEIEITPSVPTASGQQAGRPYLITLNRGQVYQLQARGDLTGSRIRSVNTLEGVCNNFAVFGGNRYTKVGQCEHPDGHDHLYDQMYPIDTWGKGYVTVPFATRVGGDLVKVLAAEDNTVVKFNGVPVTLNQGQFVSMIQQEVTAIQSDKPVSVGQFSLSQGCDSTFGDPFLVMISPNEQLMQEITFNAPSIATITSYEVTLVAPASTASLVLFDGADIGNSFSLVPQNPEYSFATIRTTGGNHTISSPGEGFIAYVYGYGSNESFGYPTGAALGNLKVDFAFLNAVGQLLPKDSLCPVSDVYFEPVSEYDFDNYIWDFGDGTVITTEEDIPVAHTYTEEGKYLVRLIASVGTGECGAGSQEVSVREVSVTYPQVGVLGPRSVCPNTDNVIYKADNPTNHSLTWSVEGGLIKSVYHDSVAIDWDETNSMARVKVLATSRFGCTGAENELPVKINVQLEPEAPFGIDSVCISDARAMVYETFATEGSVYNWYATNGEVAGGQGESRVVLNWLEPGEGVIWFEQLTTTDTICSGFSDSLFVFVQREPDPVVVINALPELPYIQDELLFNVTADPLLTLVNWDFGDGTTIDSVKVGDAVRHVYQCQGVYAIKALAYDTSLLCNTQREVMRQQTVLAPPLEMIRVTHAEGEQNTLQIDWKGPADGYQFSKDYVLSRRGSFPEATGWQMLATLGSDITSFVDQNNLETGVQGYAYQISTNADCEEEMTSQVHQSMVLEAETDIAGSVALMAWNGYEGWSEGVSEYQIWLSVDGSATELLESTTSTGYEFAYREDGFSYCFRVKAVESEGNNAWSFSNEACVEFVPEVLAYNVFTPNGDGMNETFSIKGIELFRSSLLLVVDRSGHEVLRETGYRNNWKGEKNGKPLPSGVYYYTIELNEPKMPVGRINGTVSIMR